MAHFPFSSPNPPAQSLPALGPAPSRPAPRPSQQCHPPGPVRSPEPKPARPLSPACHRAPLVGATPPLRPASAPPRSLTPRPHLAAPSPPHPSRSHNGPEIPGHNPGELPYPGRGREIYGAPPLNPRALPPPPIHSTAAATPSHRRSPCSAT